MIDRYDVTILLGLVCLAVGVWLLADWPGLVGLGGGLLLTIGLAGAMRRARRDNH